MISVIFDSPIIATGHIFDTPEFEAVEAETNSGGYTSFWDDFERELERRKDEARQRLKRKEKARKIKDSLERDLYLAERQIEEDEARRAELARINRLAAINRDFVIALDLGFALSEALDRQTFSTMERRERELKKARQEEEAFLLMASQILLEAV
jgi:hypothetical protein